MWVPSWKTLNIRNEYAESTTYSIPAIPSTTRLSLVSVPVLSKQQISTLPANGIRNGSVQNIPESHKFHGYKITTHKSNASTLTIWESKANVIGTMTKLYAEHLKNCGLIPGKGKRFISSHKCANGYGTNPVTYSMSTMRFFPRHEVDHSPPSIAKVKKECSYTSCNPYDFMMCNRDSFKSHFILCFALLIIFKVNSYQ
jgi:hypothetical protein